MPVDAPHPEYDEFIDQWTRCQDCYNGGDAVRKAGPRYLPPLSSHLKDIGAGRMPTGAHYGGLGPKYREYAMRALFYNAMGRTVDGLAGAIFQKSPTVKVSSADVEEDLKDVCGDGTPLELFALKATRSVLTTGRFGILLDLDPDPEPSEMARPYWRAYHAADIVNWQEDGDGELQMIVLREEGHAEGQDKFTPECVIQYRVLELVDGVYTQQVWRPKTKDAKDYIEFEGPIVPQRRGNTLDFIPFVFVGPTSISCEVEKPPMLDLVDVNLSHYRGSADLKHGLHFVALPTPWVSGVLGGTEGELAIGSSEAWVLDVNGKAGMLEFTGAGLRAIADDLKAMQSMMATLGARLLEEQGGPAETAYAVGMRHAGEHATLRTVASAIAMAVTVALQIHAWWRGTDTELGDEEVTFNEDFFSTRMSPDELKAQLLLLQAEAISYLTFYANITRGDQTRPGVDAEEERAEIDRQKLLTEPLTKPEPMLVQDGGPVNAPPKATPPPPPPPPPPANKPPNVPTP